VPLAPPPVLLAPLLTVRRLLLATP